MSRLTGVSKRIASWLPVVTLLLVCAVLVRAQDKPVVTATTPPAYAGPAACKGCHSKVYEPWSSSAHGKALVRDSLPPELHGCEACHGPAGTHAGSAGKNKPKIPSASDPSGVAKTCGACHFRSDSSKAPSEWQTFSATGFAGTTHSRNGMTCLACHSGHPNGNEGQLLKPAAELCGSCHASLFEASPGKKAPYTHSPVAQGKCFTCHDPHGAKSRGMLVENVRDACLKCHAAGDAKLVAAHRNYPLQDADCLSCHDPHSHDQAGKLLRANRHKPFADGKCEMCHAKSAPGGPVTLTKPANELCFSCHSRSKLMPEGEKAHPPVANGLCLTCHSPHASDSKGLPKPGRRANACFACHTRVENDTVKAHRHKVMESSLDCSMCHKPHSSANDKLLVKDQMTLCGQCHKHSLSHPMGKKADGTPVISPKTKKPMVCADCHEVHGSDFDIMTRGDKTRDLCIQCHDTEHSK